MTPEYRRPPLIEAMLNPEFYPHRPDSVELRQTHISCAFLAGNYVYKIKKPVRFDFVDYSTLEKRRHFCHEEIRLNRRLAASVYLEVVGIAQAGERFSLTRAFKQPAVEYAVKMRRLPEEHFLSRRVEKAKARKIDLDPIARKLADFYRRAAADRASRYGSADAIGQKIKANMKELEPLVGETLVSEEFGRIRDFNEQFFSVHWDRLAKRAAQGRVREGHGDLRAEHICLEEDPVIFDCIEFSEEFRYCDAASEVAFLCMDLDYLGSPLLSEYFAGRFQNFTRDPELPVLLPFYKIYRACVRGKVETLKSREGEVPEDQREEARRRARRYFQLASRYASPPLSPALLVVCGVIASGKSTVARSLADRTGYQILNSDVTRKRLAGVPLTDHPAHDYGAGLYRDDFTTHTYDALLEKAEACLKSGQGIIVDASFKDPRHRRQAIDVSLRAGVSALFIECRSSEQKIFERLKSRALQPNEVSDATAATYRRQQGEFVPLTEIPDSMRIIVNTEKNADETASLVLARLRAIVGP